MKRIIVLLGVVILSATSSFAQSTKSLDVIVKKYLDVKNALVATEGAQAQAAAKQLMLTFKSYKEANQQEAQQEIFAQIETNIQHIANTSDVEHQREHFAPLSEDMYVLAEQSDLVGNSLYLQHCPMAKGYWLSASQEIKNPYYGSKMLKCGVLKDQI